MKGQIEITKDYQVCYKDRKIGSSEVSLLQKMNLKPFFYNMNVLCAYGINIYYNKLRQWICINQRHMCPQSWRHNDQVPYRS